jgi:LuxR family maltose regulon positive regulatory protein
MLDSVEPATIRERVHWGILRSLSLHETNAARASAELAATLALARPHGYVTTIVQAGPGIAGALRSLPTAAAGLDEYVDVLVRAAATASIGAYDRAGTPSVSDGPLTTREAEVLRLLASRLTTQEIAQTLFVSPNTLKSHMKSIYHKLGINTRAEAVREGHARALV